MEERWLSTPAAYTRTKLPSMSSMSSMPAVWMADWHPRQLYGALSDVPQQYVSERKRGMFKISFVVDESCHAPNIETKAMWNPLRMLMESFTLK